MFGCATEQISFASLCFFVTRVITGLRILKEEEMRSNVSKQMYGTLKLRFKTKLKIGCINLKNKIIERLSKLCNIKA